MSTDNRDFHYKEIDLEGFENLKVIADAGNFNEWMYEVIASHCSGDILEIGSGIGNISEQFLKNGHSITLSDIRANYREMLQQRFGEMAGFKAVIGLDLVHPDFSSEYKELTGRFDTVFALNVVEHIEDDSVAISNASTLLKPGGKLIILVPAFNSLYNVLDKNLMHFRRYNKESLTGLFKKNGLKVNSNFYFNAAGIPGWYISGKLQKHETIPGGQMRLFNSLVPLFRLLDQIMFRKIGLSVVCVGEK
jgi:SAM-dependent methyltransferase